MQSLQQNNRYQSSALWSRLAKFGQWLVKPHSSVLDSRENRRVRFLAALSLGAAILNLIAAVVTASQKGMTPQFIALTGLALFGSSAYLVSRTANYKTGFIILPLFLSVAGYYLVLAGADTPFFVLLSTIPMAFVLGSVLLPFTGMVILVLVNTILVALLPLLLPSLSSSAVGSMVGVIGIFGFLLLISFAYRTAAEGQRLEEVNQTSHELQIQSESIQLHEVERLRYLALAVDVVRGLAQIRDPEKLLRDAVELILERFNLYYTQVYLVDESGQKLVLKSGTGDVGVELFKRSHSLPIDHGSINGTASIEKHAVIVPDTSASNIFLPNPLLPDTRSEMAVPLMVGERVVGVLDMQSDRLSSFTSESLPAFEALASQLAIAIENANLFTQIERIRREFETQSRLLTRKGWEDFLDALKRSERIAYAYEGGSFILPTEDMNIDTGQNKFVAPIQVAGEQVGEFQFIRNRSWSEDDSDLVNSVAQQVAQQVENLRLLSQAERYRNEAEELVRRLTREGWESFTDSPESKAVAYVYDQKNVAPLVEEHSVLYTPAIIKNLKVQGVDIGEISAVGIDPYVTENTETLSVIAEQLSAHLENLRLIEETRRAEATSTKRASELAIVAQVSTVVASLQEETRILQTVVDETKNNFHLYHAHVYLLNDAGDTLTLAAGAGEIGQKMTMMGWQIPINREHSLVARAARSHIGVIANDVRVEPDFLPNDLLPDTRSELAVPLLVGDQLLGVLDIQSDKVNYFSQEDVNVQTTLASQTAVALQNARLYEQTRQKTEQLATLNEMGRALTNLQDIQPLLETIYTYTSRLMDTSNFTISLYEPAKEEVTYPISIQDNQRIDTPARPLGDGLVDYIIRSRKPLLLGDDTPARMEALGISRLASGGEPPLAWLGVPVIFVDQVLGVISMHSDKKPGLYTDVEQDLLTTIASQAAIAIENARTFNETQRQAEFEAMINAISQKIQSTTSVENALQVAVRELGRALGSKRTSVQLSVDKSKT